MKNKIIFAAALGLSVCLLIGCGRRETVLMEVTTESTAEVPAAETEETEAEEDDSTEADSVETDPEAAEAENIFVYICGAVENPGVYELPEGSRVCDAVEAAGGMTPRAAEDYWNQAELLTDGEMLYVPTVEEASERYDPLGKSGNDDASGSGTADTGSADTSGKININTAGKDQLTQIPGVGETRAQSIIAYREEHGSFASCEDIKNVSGIGDSLYDKMKDSITVN